MLLYTYAKTSNENLFPVKQQFFGNSKKKIIHNLRITENKVLFTNNPCFDRI